MGVWVIFDVVVVVIGVVMGGGAVGPVVDMFGVV